MAGSLKPVSKQSIYKILSQMENSFFKIDINGEKSIIGTFTKIKHENINIPILIINKYIKYENISKSINVFLNNDSKTISLGKINYHNKEYNITILEIIENKNINVNYLEIDDLLYENDFEINYSNESIYIP